MPSPDSPFEQARAAVRPLDEAARAAAVARQDQLTKPPGSLGRLESLSAQLAAIAGTCPPPVPEPAAVAVFAGDHGVLAKGVSPWPQEVTAQMVANFCAGGAAINVLARQAGAALTVVDVGVATDVPEIPGVARELPAGSLAAGPVFLDRRVRPGTDDLSVRPAMTVDEARAALDVGAEVAAALVAGGARLLVTGDMGIANTTASAALVASLTGRGAAEVTGRGTGIDDETLDRKTAVVAAAVARVGSSTDPLVVLAELGGLEHAALAGFILGGVAARVPVVVDGVIALSALLVADALAPGVAAAVIAGHRSVEPGASAALDHLGVEPLLDLGLRLGEGSGAALAVPLVVAAARILGEMATFGDAGVSEA
ncbi:MAG TPA: nicotinate-nucleotide--dimethylbenzimidazole phosphoribosyltransferase [Acidimicrobiales bacterium]|jgi:nicotinate-nucleotide--dimethylbenzimidazole phosphoribosyltransferase|nr:nicotinate-nucleotide--dimethylbenzimidazole phosphoribosyltransferase [Acidimicrobiales bacterium]